MKTKLDNSSSVTQLPDEPSITISNFSKAEPERLQDRPGFQLSDMPSHKMAGEWRFILCIMQYFSYFSTNNLLLHSRVNSPLHKSESTMEKLNLNNSTAVESLNFERSPKAQSYLFKKIFPPYLLLHPLKPYCSYIVPLNVPLHFFHFLEFIIIFTLQWNFSTWQMIFYSETFLDHWKNVNDNFKNFKNHWNFST